ncbi:MAG: hypothetical protein IJX58_08295, partial [Clostridia bacterium]|nr:hypothetical protein [Clostridia bacterium]
MKRRINLALMCALVILLCIVFLSSCDLINPGGDECSHSFTDWEITKSATCATEGVRQRKCSLCGFTEEAKVEKNASHDYGEFALVEENDCLRTGKAVRTCKRCGDEDVAFVLGDHAYGEWIEAKEPTLNEEGCIGHYKCGVCGNAFDED